MKDRLLVIISSVALVIALCSGVFFGVLSSDLEDKNKEYEKIRNQAIQEETTEESEVKIDTDNYITTLNYIDIDKQNEIKQVAVNYINARYNYNGSIREKYSEILNNIEPYVATDYLEQVKISMSTGAGNMGATDSNKHIDNYCTLSDVYFTSDKYDNKDELYMLICSCHLTDKSTLYREVSIAEYETGYKVNYDNFNMVVTEE